MEPLLVFYEERHVGSIISSGDDVWQFDYSQLWRDEGFPISLSLPFEGEFAPQAAHHFFSNLLPEGELRRLLCLKLGISEANDFHLLSAIGGDCAGALSVLPERKHSKKLKADYRPISLAELVQLASGGGALTSLDGDNGLRLSLAGAQDKVPIYVDGDDLFLPVGAAASSHILKFESGWFKHLPANEVLMALVANNLDLRTSPTRLLRSKKKTLCLVERYDREKSGAVMRRLHQEDFCQGTGRAPSQKYEKEGGPPFSQLIAITSQHSAEPLRDVAQLVRWLAFNVICFNADAHAKNASLLYSGFSFKKTLAPFYDLVCTRAYPNLSSDLAMSVGGEADPTRILRRHWLALAGAAEIKGQTVIDIVQEVAERVPEAIKKAQQQFREEFGTSPAFEMTIPLILVQAKKVLRHLKT